MTLIMREFYKKPLRLKNIFENKDLQLTDPGRSISQHIEIIIFTHFGEHRHDYQYGCEIWDVDFELIASETIWEEKLRQSLLRSITRCEPRIYQVEVEVNMKEVEKKYPLRHVSEIKKQVEIIVKGKIQETGERYKFSTSLFLSPLSA